MRSYFSALKNYLVFAALVFALLPYEGRAQQFDYGTGADGAYTVTGNATLNAQVWNFTSFTIPAGDAVTVVGISSPLIIKCKGMVTINGVLTLAGQAGQTGNSNLTPDGEGAYYASDSGTGGNGGGGGGQQGGDGGTGYDLEDASGGFANNGLTFASVQADGFGGNNNGEDYPTPNQYGEGGDGASYATPGFPGEGNYSYNLFLSIDPAILTATYGNATLTDTLINEYDYTGNGLYDTTNILGGSGGGGGGANNSGTLSQIKSGCGGGGGGVKITAYNIVFGDSGLLTVRGGDGGSELTGPPYIGGGGGGSGGTINLQYLFSLTNAVIDSMPLPVTGSTVNYGGGLGGYALKDTGGRGGQGRYLAQQDVQPVCQPQSFTVSGGGIYCTGPGFPITLSGSQDTVMYQLILNDTILVGSPIAGTDSALNFGDQTTAGIYTVLATTDSGSCTAIMGDSALIGQGPPPDFTMGSNSPLCTGNILKLTSGGALPTSGAGPTVLPPMLPIHSSVRLML